MLFERMLKAKKNLGLEEKLIIDKNNHTKRVGEEEVVIGQDYIDECDYLNEKLPVEDILESGIIPEPESPNDLDPDTDVENNCGFSDEVVEKEFVSTLSVEKLPEFSEPSITNEVIEFYKNHPELKGRLYPNGALEPSLTLEDYAMDRAWVIGGPMDGNTYNELAAHDQHFQKLYEAKKSAWEVEDKEYMNKIAEKIIECKKDFPIWEHLENDEEMREALNSFEKPSIQEKEESMDKVEKFESKSERPWEDTSGKTKSFVMDFLQNYAEGDELIQELRKDLMKIMSDFYWIREGHHEHEPFALSFADALNEVSISI